MWAYLTPLLKYLTRKCTLRNPNQRVNARFQGVNHPLTRLIWTNAAARHTGKHPVYNSCQTHRQTSHIQQLPDTQANILYTTSARHTGKHLVYNSCQTHRQTSCIQQLPDTQAIILYTTAARHTGKHLIYKNAGTRTGQAFNTRYLSHCFTCSLWVGLLLIFSN